VNDRVSLADVREHVLVGVDASEETCSECGPVGDLREHLFALTLAALTASTPPAPPRRLVPGVRAARARVYSRARRAARRTRRQDAA